VVHGVIRNTILGKAIQKIQCHFGLLLPYFWRNSHIKVNTENVTKCNVCGDVLSIPPHLIVRVYMVHITIFDLAMLAVPTVRTLF
jgi:hypothetical protein